MKKRTTLPVIECRGTEYDIGRQYAEQAKENLHQSLALMFRNLEEMPYKAGRTGLLRAAGRYRNNVKNFDPEAEARVQGMADGAGVLFDEMFALQCYSELFVNYPGLAGMCTSFAATGEATKGGMTLLGQTVDWHPDATMDLVRIRHADGNRMLVLFLNGYGGFYLTSSGMGNCANLTLCPMGPVTSHIPFAFYMYRAMQKKSADDAMEILSATSRGVGYIHVVDKSGRMKGIESIYDDYVMMQPERGVLAHANNYETQKYLANDPARIYIPDSFRRVERMKMLIERAHGAITPDKMMKMMEDHEGHPKSICSHVDPSVPAVFASMTVASFVMIPGEGRILLSAGPPCEFEFREYSV